MSDHRLVTDYFACRDRFRQAVDAAGGRTTTHPIEARGPDGEELTVDVGVVGAAEPSRAVVVLSGVHGVEGFIGSDGQCALLGRLADEATTLAADAAVVVVHAVNPWGMTHSRRQNESNVDLNRNWRRSDIDPPANDAYDEIHHLACPDTATMPTIEDLLAVTEPVLAARGEPWLRDAITLGQYRHADGLHYGGDRTEASCRILEQTVPSLLTGVTRATIVDLHTGVGPTGQITLLRESKEGRVAPGLARALADAECAAVTVEVGTACDLEQLVATYQEQWVHRRGDPADPAHAAARARYRMCFTPDDEEWEAAARRGIREVLDRVMAGIVGRPADE